MRKLFFSLILGTLIAICWLMIVHTLKWVAIRGQPLELLAGGGGGQLALGAGSSPPAALLLAPAPALDAAGAAQMRRRRRRQEAPGRPEEAAESEEEEEPPPTRRPQTVGKALASIEQMADGLMRRSQLAKLNAINSAPPPTASAETALSDAAENDPPPRPALPADEDAVGLQTGGRLAVGGGGQDASQVAAPPQTTTTAAQPNYRAPFFTSWFVSIWNILFMPVFTLISSCCFRNEDSSTKKLLV